MSGPMMSLKETIAKNKKSQGTGGNNTGNGSKETRPDMSQILKGLGKVKLKSVTLERSPGGTPIRPKKQDGATSFIAQALKKKFAHRHVYSPDQDKENMNDSGTFSPSSPTTPKTADFGPHMLKPVNRRLSGITKERRRSGVLSPLAEVNM
ncbi:mitochondrial fission regulator 1-like [Lingula anatina]|uniref:Mitochondrial fission regulator 1-like n=1 Tax=Lingula anatina TaxID=7574 RepID=A0A1S3JWQ8_LINAN|nr:mitochondrial fission regulator 1-like [Lingula anatina]|eukprot:XP_013414474.1 mitochondrial fission regulator 1-like [Lingula anatina]